MSALDTTSVGNPFTRQCMDIIYRNMGQVISAVTFLFSRRGFEVINSMNLCKSSGSSPNILRILLCLVMWLLMARGPLAQNLSVAWGSNSAGQSSLPTLGQGRSIASVAAGRDHSVYLLDDGSLLLTGNQLTDPGYCISGGVNGSTCAMPPLPPGMVARSS